MRDEVYAFFIRWVYKTGARSPSFHIPGREATTIDTANVSTSDVVYPTETKNWQVYDTSTRYNATGTAPDGGVIIAKGNMAYWESTERYPDDKALVWGTLCGKPIRHHKMPSNETIHIHNQGGDKIILIGVEFNNIEYPVDENNARIKDIIGYEILRGSREGNRSIIAKGMFNNMLEYNLAGNSSKKGLIQNYPYNDLRPDNFLTDDFSVLDTGSGNPSVIDSASRLSQYKRDVFSFHSVETNFVKPYLGGNYIKLYTEERGTVTGRFEFPHKHPKHVLLTDAAFVIGAVVGAGIAVLTAIGKTTTVGGQYPLVAASGSPFGYGIRESGGGTVLGDIINVNALHLLGPALGGVGSTTAGVVALIASSAYYFGQGVDQVLEVLRNFSKERQYMLQYNSHGFYSNFSAVSNNAVPAAFAKSIRRGVVSSGAKYIGTGIHDFDATYRINNLNRNKYVAVKLSGNVPNPASTPADRTKHRLRDGGTPYSDPARNEIRTDTVAYYGAIKVDFQNQYGQLSSVMQIPTDSCIYPINISQDNPFRTGVIFGGDVYINRYTEKNPYMFFNTWMFDMPNRTEYDYRNYVNGPAPRYWVNFEKFDGEDFSVDILPSGLTGPLISFTTPADFHRLDRPSSVTGVLTVKNSYAYLFFNGVRDFFTESELNMALRDYGQESYEKFYDVYGNSFNDLSTMFRSDLITKPIYFKYDISLSASKLFNNFASWGSLFPRDYDPQLYTTCFEYYPNRGVYSLQQQSGLRRDNWRNFLPLNYRDFSGRINTIKSLNATGAMILFEDAEPLMFVGVDQLQTTGGVKVTIGDGGLFQGSMQAIVNADDSIGYANSISSRAAVNTPHGLFFVSQQTGKIMQYAGGMNEISRNGMRFWFNENLPSKMIAAYPDFPFYDNPVVGIGVQAVYDPQYELVYFTKRDYVPLRNDLLFDDPSGVPYFVTVSGSGNNPVITKTFCTFDNPAVFKPCHWTVSYDPKNKQWISFHDWKPTLLLPSVNHFFTINSNSIWRHNNRWDNYCNFYGVNYPWEVEYPVVTPNNITTLRNVEYTLDVYKFYNDGKDFHHVLDENFDRAVLYNSEQISGLLKLRVVGKNSPLDLVSYPQVTVSGIDILFSKEENKYRFNQFWDVTKDRGEFTTARDSMWNTECAGVHKIINPDYIDYFKSPLERKKFRHYGNKVILRKIVSGDKKMILKLTNSNHLNSSR
jgi:hypothetical protein